jgi:hypothetical protein
MENKKIAVVTSLFLIDLQSLDECGPLQKIPQWDYFLFTNDKTKIENANTIHWNVVELTDMSFPNGVYASKYVKWKTHELLPDYDVILYLDNFMVPNHDRYKELTDIMSDVVKNESSAPIYFRNQFHKNVASDIQWCIGNNRITNNMANNIKQYLLEHGFDCHVSSDTFWTSAIIKNNKSPILKQMGDELYDLVLTVGYRDQHWVPYLLKKYGLESRICENKNNLPLFLMTGKRKSYLHHFLHLDKTNPNPNPNPNPK